MLATFVALALAAIGAALALPLLIAAAPAARWHLVFAIGIMPLILAAYTYFVPVLTRSRAASMPALALPWLALGAGLLAFVYFLGPSEVPNGHLVAAAAGILAALGSTLWMVRRGAMALGPPHPCLRWYLGASLCLAGALGAVIVMPLNPAEYVALRRVHLHLNTLGFAGLTAIGTLQVLMPTVTGIADSQAAARLVRDFPAALTGAVLVALCADWLPPVAWIGAALYLFAIARLALAWWRQYRNQILTWHGAAPSLACALVGLTILLCTGAVHSVQPAQAVYAPACFILLFLLPLVTGAATQLLPVWLRPGAAREWYAGYRNQIGRHGGTRAVMFLAGGLLVLFGAPEGAVLSLAGLIWFAVRLARASKGRRHSERC